MRICISDKVYTFYRCYHSCLDSQYNCIPNPFITEEFVLSNSSQNIIPICNSTQNQTKIDNDVCFKKCPKDCSQSFYSISLDNKFYLTKSDSVIKVKYKSSQEFQYIAENSQTFVSYLSNIGGLLSLWFGLAFVDIETLLKLISIQIKNFFIKKVHLEKIINIFKSLLMKEVFLKFIHFVHHLEYYNWRKTLSFIFIPLLLIQFYQLINNYFKFSTEVSVKVIPYIDTNDNIELNVLPAVSLCEENIFERILNDKNMRSLFSRIEDQIINHTLYDLQYYNVPYNVYELNKSIDDKALQYSLEEALDFSNNFWLHKEFWRSIKTNDLFEDININLFNLTNLYLLDEERSDIELLLKYWRTVFYMMSNLFLCEAHIYQLNSRYAKGCDDIRQVLNIVSPFGKCHTYLYNNNNNNQSNNNLLKNYYLKSLFLINIKEEEKYRQYQSKDEDDYHRIKPYNKKFIVHLSTSLPIVTDYEIGLTHTNLVKANSFAIIITKVEFERLQYPYDTNCIDYQNNTLFDCLNYCYRDKYLTKLKCIPFIGLYTFKIDDDTSKENSFCINLRNKINDSDLNELSKKIELECTKICSTPCSETYHTTIYHELQDYFKSDIYSRFYLSQSYYLKIKYSPKKLFLSLLIDLANTQSLWYGINLTQLLEILFLSYIKKMFAFVIRNLKPPKLYLKFKVSKLYPKVL